MSSSKVALEQMHEVIANQLATVIKEGVAVKDEETGEVHMNPAPPAYFGHAIKFLADNGVKCDPLKNKPLQNLVSALPFAGVEPPDADDDETSTPRH